MGSDEGGREGSDEGGAMKDGASTDMPRDASDGRVSGLVFIYKRHVYKRLSLDIRQKLRASPG